MSSRLRIPRNHLYEREIEKVTSLLQSEHDLQIRRRRRPCQSLPNSSAHQNPIYQRTSEDLQDPIESAKTLPAPRLVPHETIDHDHLGVTDGWISEVSSDGVISDARPVPSSVQVNTIP